ncbi:site-specific integrase [uncultured Slackia sp.]|uniref:site-specific integrase n=1 Tax=uncultured Slackia sp. TaxID=665903 RepID=UPI0025F9A43E|nr:site-specific integrase [uncultured Slackia sp.]
MAHEVCRTDAFCDYYKQWITVYKEGAVRKVTLKKYHLTQDWLEKLIPDLAIEDLDRLAYQRLLNAYAEQHERQTVMDFHHQLKGAILDAVDEGLLDRDPTRKAIVKGKSPREKKSRYLNQFELHKLLECLELGPCISWDWLILLIAKTGLRFSEALAVTPKDFDFSRQTLSIDKTWDYKEGTGFLPTKNRSSVRKVAIDWQLIVQFSELVKGLPEDSPIFVGGKVYNSTVNSILARRCTQAGVPAISIHGLRHTHASLLLFAGVSIASVAKRLGHSSMNTTQKIYLHIIQELENKDIDLVMRSLSSLT